MIKNNLFRIFSWIFIIPDMQCALHLVMSMYFNYFKHSLSFLHFCWVQQDISDIFAHMHPGLDVRGHVGGYAKIYYVHLEE